MKPWHVVAVATVVGVLMGPAIVAIALELGDGDSGF